MIQCAGLIASGSRRDHHRDLSGPAADQGGGQRRQAGARGCAQGHTDPRPGHGRDHRHAAGRRRYRRGGDDRPRPRLADDRAQLRDRAARDGRARKVARRELARADLGSAKCRVARAGRRADPLPARCCRAGTVARALCARGRGQHDRRLLRHRGRAHRGSRRDAAAHRPRSPPAFAAAAQAGLGSCRRLALRPGPVAPGERLPVDRRALQRQRFAPIPPAAGRGRLGRLRRDGPRAGQGRLAHARPVHDALSGATRSPT